MNRTIPIAGALAAALGSMLSHAPAQAALFASCNFDQSGTASNTCNGFETQLGDKLFKVVSAPNTGVGTVEWTANPELNLWQADIDWEGNGIEGFQNGSFSYTAEINSGWSEFALVGLSSQGFDPPTNAADIDINKFVYAGTDATGPLLASLNSTSGGNVNAPISGTQLFVTDTWEVPEGATLDSVLNYHTQTVPGPLPVLGAVAALGFGRRMRRRLAAAGR